jgi:hypothetical protein
MRLCYTWLLSACTACGSRSLEDPESNVLSRWLSDLSSHTGEVAEALGMTPGSRLGVEAAHWLDDQKGPAS